MVTIWSSSLGVLLYGGIRGILASAFRSISWETSLIASAVRGRSFLTVCLYFACKDGGNRWNELASWWFGGWASIASAALPSVVIRMVFSINT